MEIRSIRFHSGRHIPAVLLLALAPATPLLANDLFIPDSESALNLQTGSTYFVDSAFGMDNEALFEAAENLRNNSMGTVQRNLNHQWLQLYTNPEQFKPATGGRAINEILKMGWKTYREQNRRLRENKLLRYTDGRGRLSQSVDYGVRLSDDSFRFSIQYEF